MDLIQILRARIESLGDGSHAEGLRAVLQHVQVAANHLKRGGDAPDDTAFTDAIYRTNQAFEGSLKEAYRVLADKDPMKARPFDIETFLQAQALLRGRVLEQMSRYRTEWRNPSAHDYKLDFDEDEALLAIVSVCAFAVVLVDQIAGKLSFDRAKAAASGTPQTAGLPLVDLVANALLKLDLRPFATGVTMQRLHEVHVVGAVAGHLTAMLAPDAEILTEVQVGDARLHADLIVRLGDQSVLVEVKHTRSTPNIRPATFSQLSRLIAQSGIRDVVLFMFDDTFASLQRGVKDLPDIGARVTVVAPSRNNPA